MRGFGKYVSKPLGLFVTVYATLVTLFGAAWVFCLIGWIYVDGKQDYIIDIIDLTLVALFALMGDGLAPFRAVDTYHMCYIAKYHHKTWELREKQHLPALEDHNDLPARRSSAADRDLEAGATAADMAGRYEYTVLTPTQQRRLQSTSPTRHPPITPFPCACSSLLLSSWTSTVSSKSHLVLAPGQSPTRFDLQL